MSIALTILFVWGLCGVIIAWILSRHGHNIWLLGVIGVAYGPLLVLLWLRTIQGQPTGSLVVQDNPDGQEEGWIDVLVGLDSSMESVESAHKVLDTLGPAIGRLGVASVLDHEIFNSADEYEIDERRIDHVKVAARRLGYPDAEITLLSGQPDKALRQHANDHKFDIIVVGHRRGAVSSGLRGSTAARLARNADLPVLIGPSSD